MEERHAEVFSHLPGGAAPGNPSVWIRALARQQSREGISVVRRGKVCIRVRFCTRPIRLQRVCSYMAIASSGELKAPADQAAQTLLQHAEGRLLAKQYYKEAHGLTARF